MVMLNPSCNRTDGKSAFPVLGDPPFRADRKDVAVAELHAAGITETTLISREIEVYVEGSPAAEARRSGIWYPGLHEQSNTERITVYEVTGRFLGWTFSRAWYYWICQTKYQGSVIRVDAARAFNATWRTEVRAYGYGHGRNIDWGPVDGYHIDTPAGLKAFVELLRGLAVNG